MSNQLILCLYFVIWFVHLDADVYQDRPRIKTDDGHLYIEPAFGKNIYLQTNGPESTVFVGGINLMHINRTDSAAAGQNQPSTIDLDNYLNGPDGIIRRLERLESRQNMEPTDFLLNVTLLWRRINRLSSRVTNLQRLVNSMGTDQCQSRPCLNGGTCLNLANGYHCLCPKNWEGKDCSQDVNECLIYQGTDLGCQNEANCKNTPGAYECECTSGWYGIHCTRRSKDCSGGDYEMCGHGTCVPTKTGEGIKCICEQGWKTNGTGVACFTDVNECESTQGPRCSTNPKVDCINLPGTFHCGQCPPGYEGDGYICSDIDECLTSNGGCSTSPMVTCHNTIGSRICGSCPNGYQGDGMTCTWRGSCSINRGGCHPSASCVDNPAIGGQMALCICPPGMEGDGVGLHGCYIPTGNYSRGCDINPCGIHGQCHSLRSGYTCFCHRGYGGAHCDAAQDFCKTNPCLNGGTCKTDESSSRGYRCECTAQYTGDRCHVAAKTCGGYLHAEEGNIIYPLSNSTYDHNARCAWVIHTDSDKVINVTFTNFNLEESPECTYDFLQIHDGRSSASHMIGRFCGNKFPKGGNIISSHNNLYLWFKSDHTVAKLGFALNWNSIHPVCGGEIDATTHGHVSSPGSPGQYPHNRDCYWHLTTTPGKRIQLHFFLLDIEAHSNCSYDFVAIYDGGQTTDPLLGQYCNSTHPAPVTTAGSEMLLYFHSDGYGSGYGFQVSFAPAEGIPGCGGLYTSDKGEISNPSYNGKYLTNLICEYKIRTNPDTKIRLNFMSFHLEQSARCKYDYLKVYDGPSEDSALVGRFCGGTYPKSYTSTTNQLFIKFKSDSSVISEGFRITYETVCQYTVFGDSGIIQSPGYPFSYPANRVCEYIISTTPKKVIQLSFQDFDIEDNNYYQCRYDNLEIRDGMNINATLLGRYCGGTEHTPPTLTSTHNYMYLRFSSDISISGTGFKANFTTLDVECGGIYRQTTGTIVHPSTEEESYKNDQHCEWMIIAPEGMHIKLTWNRFDLERMPGCRSDFVSLSEVDENNEIIELGKYCGSEFPPAITTTTTQLMIKFQSDNSVGDRGFSFSYAFLDDKSHCGGTYVKSHGYIYSPGWPKRYPTNRDCTWVIRAPVGQQIKLNISQFDLERPIRDVCNYGDFLEIRNGGSQVSTLIGKFCGRWQSKQITSFSNELYLHFRSDSYISGNGFKIEWDSTVTGCGGTLSSPSGSISSPNYPQQYHENAECFYRIVTSAGSTIQISFTVLDLEVTQNCRDDYIELYDGRDENAQSLGKYCQKTPEFNGIQSSGNYMFIKFRSDFFIGGGGFLLQYNTICTSNLTGSHGVIESPGYPDPYPSDLNCLWTIYVPKGNRINVTFTDFNVLVPHWYRPAYYHGSLASLSECGSDYLQMKESSEVNFRNKLCGDRTPPKISTNSNTLQIKFVTGAYNLFSAKGFRMEWAKYGCGGYIQKNFGVISLDRSSTTSAELECDWVIETPQGTSVTLHIIELYMMDSFNCSTDAIEIYNGKTMSTPLLNRICHRNSDTTVTTTTNSMLVRFIKRSTLKDVHISAQFDSFRMGCGGRVQALSGLIYSKNYPKDYDDDMNCMWTLIVPHNHRIQLNFMDLDLYSNSQDAEMMSCGDSISIYDGDIILNTNYTKRICPNTPATTIISKSNIIGVQFLSDSNGKAKGFKANFTVICGATITARYDGIITNVNDKWLTTHISDNCTWTIWAPLLDQKISLTITHLSIPKNTDIKTNRKCPSSYLRVYDGDNADAPLVEEYCGRKVPPMIVSSGSAITIMFGAYNGSAQGQFAVHYSPLTSACGGSLTSEEGSIASPNYPLSYPSNATCEWILSTSPGNRVYITFERFDLELSENCNEDYLEVREDNGAGKLLGVYCGSEIPTNTTTAAKLYMKFHSNSENSGTGFLLHYGFQHGNDILINNSDRGEITSPLYPHPFEGAGEFSWRVSTGTNNIISITVDTVEIPTYGSSCSNSLTFYDGYDEEAPVLEEICGVLESGKQIKTSSNVAYIKLILDESNSGSLFSIRYANYGNDILEEDKEYTKPNCGFNETKVVDYGQTITINTPGYPESYNYDLKCEWVFQAQRGRHIVLHFKELKLEQTPACFADSVSIYSSNSPSLWKPVKENICLSEEVKDDFNSSNYMKIVFKSDSSIEEKGFKAQVISACGGFINELSGFIEPRIEDFPRRMGKCEWIVKVRPGRVIKLNFEKFNITSRENVCSTFVILRNGDSVEAPLLGSGRYCGYNHENKSEIITTSNSVFIAFNTLFTTSHLFANFRLRYEEMGIECGRTSRLDTDHSWEVLSSPNYPSVPPPYSECVWLFEGPPGEILRIDFIDRFDLDRRSDCMLEYVEIRDGSSDLSPLKGRYCEMPSTIKTTSNQVYIKYYSQLAEPRNGFKANVSIDVCGGTIRASRGEVTSPGYPHLPPLPSGSVCEWRIIGSPRFNFFIKPLDIQLPESEVACGTQITIQEIEPFNKSMILLQTYCIENDVAGDLSPISTSSNEVIITLRIGRLIPSYSPISANRGFRFSFNSSTPSCGGDVTTPEGYLTSPGYPRETTLRYCVWRIKVPNELRRVRLEITDADTERQRIGMYNDFGYLSELKVFSEEDNLETNKVFESSGNTLLIYTYLLPLHTRSRFKAKFSSDEPALCGGTLGDPQGVLTSPELDRSYTCEWHYRPNLLVNTTTFNTAYVTVKVNTSNNRNVCLYKDPKLTIRTVKIRHGLYFTKQFCSNVENSFRFPTKDLNFKATKNENKSIYFKVEWKLKPCGGVIEADENAVNILNVPDNYNDTLDCAWLIEAPIETRLQLKLEGSFQLDCSNEYIKISQGFDDRVPVIGDYCKDRMQETPLRTSYRFMFVQYHSNVKSDTRVRLMVRTMTDHCGGVLTDYQRFFESPHFPNGYDPNIECTWEITSDQGNRISLNFIDRFAIEESTNCTKDVVIVYDWQDNIYTEMRRLCGRNLPPAINSTLNRMKVVFRSDNKTQLDGFRSQWNAICGGNFTAKAKEQFLYSPGRFGAYLPDMNCIYNISGNSNKIQIKFLEFMLEGTYPECSYDNLTIKGGYYGDYYATYCGTEVPDVPHAYTELTLVFKTDGYIQRKGFKISYQLYQCGGKINQPTKISSNSESSSYENNENCTWIVEAPKDKIVVVKFQKIDLESGGRCYRDYVSVFNGKVIDNEKRIALLCGLLTSPPVFRSIGNTMVIQFLSDSSLTYKGFTADIFFSYSSSVGCGGEIDLTHLSPGATHILKSPLVGGKQVYENFLNCQWNIKGPKDYSIKIKFNQFHIESCAGDNQTANGVTNCECDYVKIMDGINPNDLDIGMYCGHVLPQVLVSTGTLMSVNLHTDGELVNTGFEAELSLQRQICGQTMFTVGRGSQTVKTPGFDLGVIPRGLHCTYHFGNPDRYTLLHLTIKRLDIRPGDPEPNLCNKDKIVIFNVEEITNQTLGKDFVLSSKLNYFNYYISYYFNEEDLNLADRYEYCGIKSNIDLYLYGSVSIQVLTSADSDSLTHKGVEIEVVYAEFCGRNYTELYGRIANSQTTSQKEDVPHECYTLITAPENYTISLYFLNFGSSYYEADVYLDIYDGDKTSSPKLLRIQESNENDVSVFSTGRHVLLHNHFSDEYFLTYDLNYIATDKGRGCGGKLHGLVGKVTSPLYPGVYRQRSTCEWELETPAKTRLRLSFTTFDLGSACDTNYVQLVDRSGSVISTYCEETPADYTSPDNYVKIVFTTTRNNAGTGWVAIFITV